LEVAVTMVRFNPKGHSQPDRLKTIQPRNLIRMLEPSREYLETRGLPLPREDELEIDYMKLAGILAVPDEWMDASIIEGLHLVGNLGTDENFDQLLDVARRNFIEVDVESTAADLAARIWLEAPQALELKEREAGSQRRRKFESFRAREPGNVLRPEQLPMQFDELEVDMEGWFMSKMRGVGCRVIRTDLPIEIRFMVQHGQPFKREPSRKGPQSTYTLFRPEKTDLVIYDFLHDELRISTSTIGELRLYREKFGKYVFGDPEKFVYSQKYTLAPLKTDGAASLLCRDVGGIEWVRLTELEYAWPCAFDYTERHKANDVFKALDMRRRGIETEAELLHARFAVKLAGETNPRPVSIQPPNIAEYGRGEESAFIEQWLRVRGFVLVGLVADDENPQSFMAVA
jgi:hypothetical protein